MHRTNVPGCPVKTQKKSENMDTQLFRESLILTHELLFSQLVSMLFALKGNTHKKTDVNTSKRESRENNDESKLHGSIFEVALTSNPTICPLTVVESVFAREGSFQHAAHMWEQTECR